MNMQIGFVVLHYSFSDLTDACLSSLREHAPTAPVLVVDNGSPEPYTADVDILRLPDNRSLAAAMNIGTKALFDTTDSDVGVQLNNDTMLTGMTVAQLAWAFDSEAKLGVAAPVMDQEDAGFMYQPCPFPPGPKAEVYLAGALPVERLELVPYVDNTALAIRRRTWVSVGELEERFTGASWGANYDYCWRARAAGWQCGLVRSAFVFHRHRGTWGRLDPEYADRAATRMMEEMREVWGHLADVVSCRDLVREERQRISRPGGHAHG